jgi:hypothetical protein
MEVLYHNPGGNATRSKEIFEKEISSNALAFG